MGVQGEVHLPRSFEELWPILHAEPEAALMAGGTDLLVSLRAGRANPGSIVCLERMAEIKGVRDEGRNLWIGAGEMGQGARAGIRSCIAAPTSSMPVYATTARRKTGSGIRSSVRDPTRGTKG